MTAHRLRVQVAVGAVRAVNAVSRRLGLGSGTVIGGRIGLVVEPDLLSRLTRGRRVALVSGTNGKTTTTRLLSVALEDGFGGPVVTNATGSNMPAGHAAALAGHPDGPAVVLEVDEGYLPHLVAATSPEAVVLLNLSRDQLDRTSEVRMLAGRWRHALAGLADTTVVANADDPLVAWAAGDAPRALWAGVGLGWRNDAAGCPSCGGRIEFGGPGGWRCGRCGFGRPATDVELGSGPEGPVASWHDGTRQPMDLGLPGRFNRANAVMALAAARALGVGRDAALDRMAAVSAVAGRFTTPTVGGVPARLLLAKNPAGWSELLEMVAEGSGPVVVGINARVADGRDPSWLWDVPFEMLRGRTVVATGDRCLDLSVRLRYAEVAHRVVRDPQQAVRAAAPGPAAGTGPVEFIGNYTSFHDVLARGR